jgi:hypothetical protein
MRRAIQPKAFDIIAHQKTEQQDLELSQFSFCTQRMWMLKSITKSVNFQADKVLRSIRKVTDNTNLRLQMAGIWTTLRIFT